MFQFARAGRQSSSFNAAFCLTLFLFGVMGAGCTSTPIPKCPGRSPAIEAQDPPSEWDLSANASQTYKKVRAFINTREKFHHAVLARKSYHTPFSFYLLGIEKPRDNSNRPYCHAHETDCTTPKFDPHAFRGDAATRGDIEDRLFRDMRSMVLTHILRVKKTSPEADIPDQDECYVFNVYGDTQSVPWCRYRHIVEFDSSNNEFKTGKQWTREGWTGLDRLGDEIREAAAKEKPTHIIVLATGWNTREYESYHDFRYWMNRIGEDFKREGKDFRPIFIGTAWESEWPSWFWRKLPFFSWSTKGNDADEIGYGWENYLLHDVLMPIADQSGAKLVAIGHSFGTRIVLSAHYVRDVLIRPNKSPDSPLTIIGMQAAFPTGRFISSSGKEHQYARENKGRATVVITTSQDDEATKKISIGTGYVGGQGGLDEIKADPDTYERAISVKTTTQYGKPTHPPLLDPVTLYDASPFVSCELKGTESGAHSDVYDEEMGHFLGEIIRAASHHEGGAS